MAPAHLNAVVSDIVAGRYTDVQISAFVAAASGQAFDHDETVALTQAMLAAGDRLH
jgi:thymidine phosphorylase